MTKSVDLTHPGDPSDPSPVEVRLALELVKTWQRGFSRKAFLREALPGLFELLGGDVGGLVVQRSGDWVREVWSGESVTIPELLVADAVDRGSTQMNGGWCVVPISAQSDPADVSRSAQWVAAMVFRLKPAQQSSVQQSSDRAKRLGAAAEMLAAAVHRIELGDRQTRRIEQLSAVLQAAAEWQRPGDDDALLYRIADTATELLHCERASIFLWDRRRKKLIGRPALGVEGDQLEVDDSVGVVGEVLRSAEAKIWNGGSDDESRVNRKVDESLEFQTRSLVAVPMSGQRDELIGVFEAINHQGDGFEETDAVILADLALHAAVAIQAQKTVRDLTKTRDRLVDDAASDANLIGEDSAIVAVRETAAKVAVTDLSVLILGSNGTGKEVLAKHVHFLSERRSGPFIAVNCAALVESLLESELFGHEKGAFTDAQSTRPGKFELASGGTLFLDEIGDMSLSGQAKLLRVLEEKVIVRVGGSQSIPVDVRVIAATNQPLDDLIREKKFRQDLFFRLDVVKLALPPLAERGDDVLVLADHFLTQFCYQIGRQVPTLQPGAIETLRSHRWPGNVRELRNTIERVAYLCTGGEVSAEDLMIGPTASADDAPIQARFAGALNDATRDFQVSYIQEAIRICKGNMTEAAARLGLHRSNLYRKMRQLGLPTAGGDERDDG